MEKVRKWKMRRVCWSAMPDPVQPACLPPQSTCTANYSSLEKRRLTKGDCAACLPSPDIRFVVNLWPFSNNRATSTHYIALTTLTFIFERTLPDYMYHAVEAIPRNSYIKQMDDLSDIFETAFTPPSPPPLAEYVANFRESVCCCMVLFCGQK